MCTYLEPDAQSTPLVCSTSTLVYSGSSINFTLYGTVLRGEGWGWVGASFVWNGTSVLDFEHEYDASVDVKSRMWWVIV